jgi:hypothetical protein
MRGKEIQNPLKIYEKSENKHKITQLNYIIEFTKREFSLNDSHVIVNNSHIIITIITIIIKFQKVPKLDNGQNVNLLFLPS